MRRLLTILAAGIAFPLGAFAAQQGGAIPPSGPSAEARNDDAGTKPASVVPAPANDAAPVVTEQQPAGADATLPTAPATLPTAPAAPGTMAPVTPAPTLPAPAPVTMPSGSATGSLLQTLFALVAVLALLAGLAWFLKRYGPKVGGGTANLRIVGSLNLGGRERLLVVEVGDQWIVVGASPGRVNALATMPRQESAGVHPGGAEGATLAPHAPAANSFADWLKQTIDKRK
jgi:flagellar protein FliO/FliZ